MYEPAVCLLLNVVKSVEDKYPFTAVVAAGIEIFGVVPPEDTTGAVAVTLETDPAVLANTCGAAPSQYIILSFVVLYQVRPLSPKTNVPVSVIC